MSDTENVGGYAYADDEEAIGSGASVLSFGLNAGVTCLKKFEWIPNGGKDGAEGEALDIIFETNGKEKGARKFPVTKAFAKGNAGKEITDPKAPEIQQAKKDLGAMLTHIMTCFVPKDDLITALSVPVASFKAYCNILMALLPIGFEKQPLDCFAQYQWQITGENEKTYLDFPKNMKTGRWLCKAVIPVDAEGQVSSWKAFAVENPDDSNPNALVYKDEAGNIHPFIRNGWFMNSNFAHQQKLDETPGTSALGAAPASTTGAAPAATAPGKW